MLKGIKKTEVWKQGSSEMEVAQSSRSVNISISDLFDFVKTLIIQMEIMKLHLLKMLPLTEVFEKHVNQVAVYSNIALVADSFSVYQRKRI